ncbi:MAG: CBS domain-containing protein [Burkholderiaceae bacterium]
MNDTIATLMTRQVRWVDMDDTVAQVETVLSRDRLSWVPVLEGGRSIMGVISVSDLLQFHAQNRDAASVHAWQLCSYKPISVDQATPLSEVARAMIERRVHHVVVTSGDAIVGVVSSLDFVQAFVDRR